MATLSTEPQTSLWRSRGLSLVVDYAQVSHRRAAAVLVALALLAFLPGFFQIPPVDRDEARFAQASKQMVNSGDYIDIRFQDEVRYKKPVGIYWLQAGIAKVASRIGGHEVLSWIWLYRLPSLIGAIGAVLLTYWTALAFVTRRTAIIAAAMIAGSVLLGVEARLAKTDAMLLLTVVAAMGAMARVYLAWRRDGAVRGDWTHAGIFWTAMAGGILLKGPLIVMFVALTALALGAVDRSLRWLMALRPLPGLLWMLLLVAPWFLAILERTGGEFFSQAVGHDMLAKVTSSQEAHGAPPGTYLILFFVTFWPGCVLAGMSVPALRRAWRQPNVQFLLAWLIPSWIVFEIVVTKLPHYVLPLYPAAAILIAGILESGLLSKARWFIHGTIGWFVFPAVITVAAVVGIIMIGREPGWLAWPFAAGAMIAGLFAWRLYQSDGAERALLRAICASVLVSITVYGIVLPGLPALFPSAALGETFKTIDCKTPEVVSVGYQEPSLVFFINGLRFTDATSAADFLLGGTCRFALVDARNERAFAQRADAIGLRYAPGPRIEGYNISVGRPVSVAIYRSARDR